MTNNNVALASLDAAEITARVVRPGGLWREVRVVAETGSTNVDLLAAARVGAAEGTVLVAEAQTAGRGRLGRRWASPPRAGRTFSVLLRPLGVPAALLGWLPLLTGVAAASAVVGAAAADVALKWPNDVLAGGVKLGGILAERAGSAIVVGVGIYVWHQKHETLRVTSAAVAVTHPAAGCDATANIVGTVYTNGRGGPVSYQWIRGSAKNAPVLVADDASGSQTVRVELRWTFHGKGTDQAVVEFRVLKPEPAVASTTFTYSCR